MRSNFLSTILIAVSVAQGVLSIPLELSHGEAKTDEEKANLANLQGAKDEANRQIPLMEKVLADPTNAKHKPLIDAAFGTHSSLDLTKVKDNVKKLKTGTVPVHLPTAEGGSQVMAYNLYDADKPPMNPVHVEFGKKYHKAAVSTQAGTLIHEATHYLGNTGDYIENNKMLKGNQHETEHMGYTSKQSFYKTPKSLNGDKTWTNMRDSTANMHDNAEAYGQFASLCANANLERRDLENFRRALVDGDSDSIGYYLAKRSSCKLPKDYFKKKAAQKAAAEGKKGVHANTGAKNAKSSKHVASPKSATKNVKAKGAKSLASSTKSRVNSSKFGKHVSAAHSSKITKPGVVKKLPGGRTAKSVGKVAGSRRPVNAKGVKGLKSVNGIKKKSGSPSKSKVGVKHAAGKRVAKTGANKSALKVGAVKPKNPSRKSTTVAGGKRKAVATKKPVPRVSNGKGAAKKPLNKKKVVAHKSNVANKKPVARTASNKKIAKPTANRNVRPASHAQKRPAAQPRKAVASKKVVKPNTPNSRVAHKSVQKNAPQQHAVQHKVTPKPKVNVNVAQKAAPKAAPKKAAPKVAPKATSSKKGRRDLEEIEEFTL